MRSFLIFTILCIIAGAATDEFAAKGRYRGEVWQESNVLAYKLNREVQRWVNWIGP